MGAAAVTALALVAVNVALVVVLVVRRWWVVRAQRRHDRLVRELRRPAVVLIDADPPEPVPELTGHQRTAFAELLADYSRQLTGASRARIVDHFETTGAVDDEIARLRSARASRRAAAAFTLGDMGSSRAVPALVGALDDAAREVRMAAVRSLGRIGAVDAIGPLVTAGVAGRVPPDVASLALFDIGPDAVGPLLELVNDPEPRVRASAVELVGLLGSAGDAGAVLAPLADPAAEVRAAAAGALGRLGAGAARDALIRALEDRVPSVRAAAATALGEIGGRQAVSALVPIARADAFDVARAAADALARLDPVLVARAAAEPGAGPHLHEAADRAAL